MKPARKSPGFIPLSMWLGLSAATSMAADALDRTVLPLQLPKRPLTGELDARNYKAPPRVEPTAPAGAPNVLIVLIDDLGFGATSSFGGPIKTPRWTGWQATACAITISTPPPFARPPVPR